MSQKAEMLHSQQHRGHRVDQPLRAEVLMPILQKRIAIIPGGRDHHGGAIIVFPSVHEADMKILQDDVTLSRLLLYLSHVPSNEVRTRGFTFIIDMRSASWSDHVKPILKCIDEHFTQFTVNNVLIVKPENFWQKQKANVGASKYRFDVQMVGLEQLCSSRELDHQQNSSFSSSSSSSSPATIPRSQIIIELGGTMPYCHEIWLQLRLEFESFTTKAVELMHAFDHQRRDLQHAPLPETLHDIKMKQQEHGELVKQLDKRARQADEFMRRGRRLSTKLSGAWTASDAAEAETDENGVNHQQQSVMSHYSLKSDESSGRGSTNSSSLHANADFIHDSTIVGQLIKKIELSKTHWMQVVEQRRARLDDCCLLRVFEVDINKVLQCIDDKRDELLLNSNYTEIGESRRNSAALLERHREYKKKCESQLVVPINQYCATAINWIKNGHFAQQQLHMLVSRVNCEWQTLDDALRDRETVLQLSTNFHTEAERFLSAVPNWRRQCTSAIMQCAPSENGNSNQDHTDNNNISCAINNSATTTTTTDQQRLSDRTRELEQLINQHKELNDEIRQHFDVTTVVSKELMFRLNQMLALFRQRIVEQHKNDAAENTNNAGVVCRRRAPPNQQQQFSWSNSFQNPMMMTNHQFSSSSNAADNVNLVVVNNRTEQLGEVVNSKLRRPQFVFGQQQQTRWQLVSSSNNGNGEAAVISRSPLSPSNNKEMNGGAMNSNYIESVQTLATNVNAALRQQKQQQTDAPPPRNSIMSVNSSSSSSSLSTGNGHHHPPNNSNLSNNNASYTKAATHVLEVQQRVTSQFKELQQLWNLKRNRLHQQWALQLFREDVKQVIDWLKNHGEAFLQKNNEVGKTLQRAKRLYESHEHFTNVAQNTYYNADKLVKVAEQFVLTGECNRAEIEHEKQRLQQHIDAFYRRVNKRQELLEASLKFHGSHTKLHSMLTHIEPLLRDERDEYPNTYGECSELIKTMEHETNECMSQIAVVHDAGVNLHCMLNDELARTQQQQPSSKMPCGVPSVTVGEISFLKTILQQLCDKQRLLKDTWLVQRGRLQIVLEFRQYENDIIDLITQVDQCVLVNYHQLFQHAGLFDASPPPPPHNNGGVAPQRDFKVLLFVNAEAVKKERDSISALGDKCKAITDAGKKLAKNIRANLGQNRRTDYGEGNLPSPPDAAVGNSSSNSNSIEEAIADRIEQLHVMAVERLQALNHAFNRRIELAPLINRLEMLVDDSQRLVRSLTSIEQIINDWNIVPLNGDELEQLRKRIESMQALMNKSQHSAENIEHERNAFFADNGPFQLNLTGANSYELCLIHGALSMRERLRRRNDELDLLCRSADEFLKNADAVRQVLRDLENEYRQRNNEDSKTMLNSVMSSGGGGGSESAENEILSFDAVDLDFGGGSLGESRFRPPSSRVRPSSSTNNNNNARQVQLQYALKNVQRKIDRHTAQNDQFRRSCQHVRLTGDIFKKIVRRNISLTYDENSYRYATENNNNNVDALKIAAINALNDKMHASQHDINNLLDEVADLGVRVMSAWNERQNRLEELQRYLNFEMSARISLDWIDEHGEQCLRRARQQIGSPTTSAAENDSESQLNTLASSFDVEKLLRDQGETVLKLSELAQRLNDKGSGSYAPNIQECVRQVDLKYKEFVQRLEKYRNNTTPSSTENEKPAVQPSSRPAEIVLVEKRSSRNLQRDYVIRELIHTEETYCKDLYDCIQTYMAACVCGGGGGGDSSENEVPLAIRNKHDIIFGNIRELYQFHSEQLLCELRRYEKSPENVGHCFAMWELRFDLYVDYCKNKSRSMDLLLSGGTPIAAFFAQVQKRHNLSENISSYLIKPVQRIGKYPLLLDELLKTRDAAEKHDADDADGLQVMKRLLSRTNNAMELALLDGQQHNVDQFGDVLLVDSFSVRDFAGGDVVLPTNAVEQQPQPKKSKKLVRLTQRTKADRERTLFLCERALLVCKKQIREGASFGGGASSSSSVTSFGSTPRYQLKLRIPTSSLLSIKKPNDDLGVENNLSSDSCLVLAYTPPNNNQSTKRLILHSTVIPMASSNVLQQQRRAMSTWLEELTRIIDEFGAKRQQDQNGPPPSMRNRSAAKSKVDKTSRSSVSSSNLSDSGAGNSLSLGGGTSNSSTFDENEDNDDDDNMTMNDDLSTNNGRDTSASDGDNLSQDIVDDFNNTIPHNNNNRAESHSAQPPPPLLQLNKESIKRQLTAWFKQPLKKLGHSMSSVESQYLGGGGASAAPGNRSSVHEQQKMRTAINLSSSKRFSWDSQTVHSNNNGDNNNNCLLVSTSSNCNSDDGVSLASSSNDIDLPPAMSKIVDPLLLSDNESPNSDSGGVVLLSDLTNKLAIVDKNQNSSLRQQK